jgi:translocation protein SEC62
MLRKFLENEMFRRVVKVYKEEKSSSDQTSSNTAGETSQSNTPRTARQRKTKSTATVESTTTTKDDDSKEKDKIKKKKFKFELHEEQTFTDSPNEFYVWIYSPTTIKQYIMGALLVIGCIGVCLFPLWPAEVRTGVYYLSLVLASLLGLLLSLAVIKYILFAGVWLLTMGKIKFWLLPNLTEDVGFIESFIPLYTLNVTTKKKTSKNDEKKENVEEEEEEEEEEKTTNEKENLNEENKKTSTSNVVGPTESEQDDEDKEKSTSRSSSIDEVEDGNKPQKSSDEDFEVLSKDELETK